MRTRTLLSVVTVVVALTTAGCSSVTPPPAPPTATALASPAPVLDPDEVPAGMSEYTFASSKLAVTLPKTSKKNVDKNIAAVVDALAGTPATLVTTTDKDGRTVLVVTWTTQVSSSDVDKAKTAATKAVKGATAQTATKDVVGIKWQAPAPTQRAATFVPDLNDKLVTAVPGRFTIDDDSDPITVTWVAPGLTSTGRDAVTVTIAQAVGVAAEKVTVSPIK